MVDTHLSTAEIRRQNRNKVYSFIYTEKMVSKQGIAQGLQMSMPTVTQNLKELQQMKMIEKNGLFESTGGRKAQMITCVKTAKISLGVEILKDCFHIAAVNLYGEILKETTCTLPYVNVESYYRHLGEQIDSFINSLPFSAKRLLGIGISLQGLVSMDNDEVVWGKIMDNTGITRKDFAPYIHWPFILVHDSEAAAFAELWYQNDTEDALYVSLNRYLGSALLINGTIYRGKNSRSGTIEHMCLVENGRDCYCGKKGCLDTYCSANALEKDSGLDLETFFTKVRSNDLKQFQQWNAYLSSLSLAINNSLSIVDTNIIIGGFLVPFMNKADILLLKKLIQKRHAFPLENLKISFGQCGDNATKIGSALYYIEPFLRQI